MTRYNKKLKFTYIKYTLITLFVCILFMDGYTGFEKSGDNYFHIFVNSVEVGVVENEERAWRLMNAARRSVAAQSENMIFIDADMTLDGEEVLWGAIDSDKKIKAAIVDILEAAKLETAQKTYTVKLNDYMINLQSADEVRQLLQAAVDKYDSDGLFTVELKNDTEREFNVVTATVTSNVELEEAKENSLQSYTYAGVESFFQNISGQTVQTEKDFSDFDLGLKSVWFSEQVEIAEAYMPAEQLTDLVTAIDEVTKEQETASEYEVVSGDTLSEIAIKVNIPMEDIVDMNDALEDVNTPIRIGQKLVITVPEPELSVERVEENYYEEIYDADIIYIDNDEWYTTQTKTLQQPSAGFRKVVADVHYVNDKEVDRDILKEEVVVEAVPKIVERGTKIPPTYIKPISGGRLTSGFGRRNAPKKGASTYHKGVDWATPTGTPVYASCGGTVAKAGWGSGYGYVVYINHEDGRQTRYGHLSKVLVSTGQTVKQGDKIALSGNTGVSTGPHLHFEILINGSQVNPLNYLN